MNVMQANPTAAVPSEPFLSTRVESPLGPILLVADDHALHILEFDKEERADREASRHEQRTGAPILPGRNAILDQAAAEVTDYFDGTRSTFDTPITLWGDGLSVRCVERAPHHPGGRNLVVQRACHCGEQSARRARRGPGQWRQPVGDHRAMSPGDSVRRQVGRLWWKALAQAMAAGP